MQLIRTWSYLKYSFVQRKLFLKQFQTLWKRGGELEIASANANQLNWNRYLNTSCKLFKKKKETVEDREDKRVAVRAQDFRAIMVKNKDVFKLTIQKFQENNPHRRGHVEFIRAALMQMKEFGVEKDIEIYKQLFDIFPKGTMVPTNLLQVEFLHFPRQQECAIDMLRQMEDNFVMPDEDIHRLITQAFGYRGRPFIKLAKMLYWMPKFKHASPFKLPNPLPNDILELAKLAVARMCSVDHGTIITVFEAKDVKDSIDDTWIVSGQSPLQQELINKHDTNLPLYVDGAYRLWLRNTSVSYFILRADPKPGPQVEENADDITKLNHWLFNYKSKKKDSEIVVKPSVHEQDNGTIMSVCVTGTSSRDSLLTWIRCLQSSNPKLNGIPILFKLKAPSSDVVPVNVSPDAAEEQDGLVSDLNTPKIDST